MTDNVEIRVGSRIIYNEHFGTVKWVGKLPLKSDTWLGIEWDEPELGLHDGIYKGVQYFKTKYGKSGSFIKQKSADPGISFINAVRNRYCAAVDDVKQQQLLDSFGKNINAPFVQNIGFERIQNLQSQLKNLRVISLRGEKVFGEPYSELIREMHPNVQELDLSLNLLASWMDVAMITKELKHLESLNLSSNMLQIPDYSTMKQLQIAFKTLKRLILCKCKYNWDEVVKCAVMWPDIKELRLEANIIEEIKPPPSGLFNELVNLDLQDNLLTWDSVKNLRFLPNLQELNLRNTGISIITEDVNGGFKKLGTLLLSQNQISEWNSIACLDKLPALQHLTLWRNPVFERLSEADGRQKVIARIAKLQTLNHSTITGEERRGAEIDYLKEFATDWFTKDRDLFLKNHPRYEALIKSYGLPEEPTNGSKVTLLKDELITIIIKAQSKPLLKKAIPRNMQVAKLRQLVSRFFSLDSKNIRLKYQSSQNPDVIVDLDKDLLPLDYFGLSTGDTLLVH